MKEEEKDLTGEASLQSYENDKAEAIAAIKKFADDEEDEKGREISWRTVLGGDVLQSKILMKQVIFVMFLAVLMLIYTGNRYASQQDAITIEQLQEQLQDVQWDELTVEGDLTNLKRQSELIRQMRENNDTTITQGNTPYYKLPR